MLCQFLLYIKVTQVYVYIYPHIPSLLSLPPALPIPPLQVVTKHRADLPVLCSSFPLAILHLLVYICQCYFVASSQPPLPLLCPQVRSLRLHLYSCPATRFISTIFLDSVYRHKQHKSIILQFCRSQVEYGSHWGDTKVSTGLHSFLAALGENTSPCLFRLLAEFSFQQSWTEAISMSQLVVS